MHSIRKSFFELRTNTHDYEKLPETLEKNGENSKSAVSLRQSLKNI